MQLVKRTLKALSILSKERDGISVSALAEKLDIPASSAHRILTCLREERFVSQDEETKKYRIGYMVLTLGANIAQENSLVRTARPFITKMAEQTGKTVSLCIMEGNHVVCVDFVESKDTALFFVRTGFAMPPNSTSAGKAIQAYIERESAMHIFKHTQPEVVTKYTITDEGVFCRELDKIKQQGYAVCDEELQIGVQGVACPVFDMNHRVVAAVSFTALKAEAFITEGSIGQLKECAGKISKSLGYSVV